MRRCPICKNRLEPGAGERWEPFCSARCKTVDLGNWLGEGYRIPDRDGERPDEPRGGSGRS